LARFKQVQTLLRQWRLERPLQLLESPWDAVPERSDQTALRHAFFGEGNQGMLSLLIDDKAETMPIIDILWAG
jgi:hypothetical protein